MRAASVRDIYPSKKDEAGTYLCAWCSKPLSGRKRRYCSEACMDEVFVRCNSGHARDRVWRRDGGVCAHCGIDTKKPEEWLRLRPWRSMLVVHGFQRKVRDAIARQLDRAGLVHRFGHGHVWEMNHITPVKDGGGLCGLDGLETLCLRCHRTETKQQRGRWAREKRLANGEAEQLSLLPS